VPAGNDVRSNKDRASSKYTAKKAAKDRIAIQRAAKQKADRRRNVLVTGGTVAVILIVVGVIVIVGIVTNHPKSGTAASSAPTSVTKAIADVPTSAFDAVSLATSGFSSPPKALSGQPALTSGGKAEVLYMGAEYCPYCAAERWPLAVALSRFGSFSGLKETTSSPSDVYPSTPTLSFHGATYASNYINFTSVEMESNQVSGKSYAPLETPTADEAKLLDSLDVSSDGKTQGGIPFIDYGNKFAQVDGANYTPQLLAGMTQDQVAAAIAQPTSKVGAAILGTANVISSYICQIDGAKPASVCTSTGVATATAILAAATTK
jgi:hypothetical protein